MRKFMITVQGVTYDVDVQEVAAGAVAPIAPVPVAAAPAPVAAAPAPAPVAAPAPAPVATAPAPVTGGETIASPMPGNILSVKVRAGDSVKKGDVLLVLEAMKMENEIMSPRDGQVAQVAVNQGATVNSGDALIVLA